MGRRPLSWNTHRLILMETPVSGQAMPL